jgi:hypothetical protein
MKTLIISLALATLALPAAAETTWSGTGPRGGSYSGSGSCAAGNGSVNCTSTTTAINPYGQTATRQRSRVATEEGVSASTVTTGPAGGSATRSRSRSR